MLSRSKAPRTGRRGHLRRTLLGVSLSEAREPNAHFYGLDAWFIAEVPISCPQTQCDSLSWCFEEWHEIVVGGINTQTKPQTCQLTRQVVESSCTATPLLYLALTRGHRPRANVRRRAALFWSANRKVAL